MATGESGKGTHNSVPLRIPGCADLTGRKQLVRTPHLRNHSGVVVHDELMPGLEMLGPVTRYDYADPFLTEMQM